MSCAVTVFPVPAFFVSNIAPATASVTLSDPRMPGSEEDATVAVWFPS